MMGALCAPPSHPPGCDEPKKPGLDRVNVVVFESPDIFAVGVRWGFCALRDAFFPVAHVQ